MVTIESSKLFARLGGEDLALLRKVAQQQRYPAGHEIFKEGDPGEGVYFLEDGQVEICAVMGNHRRQVLSYVEPGQIFGEMAVLEDQPRSACARAKTDTIVRFVPRAEMLQLVERSPALAMELLREISRRLREFDRQHLREVLQAERLTIVGRFARSIVHDLKNPLNLIGLTAEIAGMDQATPEMRASAVTSIRAQVDRISDLISEILDFTQGAHTDLILGPVDYAQFVRDVVEEIRPEAALKSVTIELDGALPQASLLIHPKRLRRVFHNLVHNATDAIGEGGKVFIRVRATPAEIVTEVEDTGPGISPEIAPSLFEPFATYGKAQGTGLGLSICRRVLDDHQGWITARNQPGRGALFSFGLPLASGKESAGKG